MPVIDLVEDETVSETDSLLPVGKWEMDPIHSSASFAVKHMGISVFRGHFDDFDATFTVDEKGTAELVGTVKVASLKVKEERLQGHLGSPDFFDLERYPEIHFLSRSIEREGELIFITGALTIKDQTQSVDVQGAIAGPSETMGGAIKIGVTLDATIDRTKFGLEWNAPLPSGDMALGNNVELAVELEFSKSEE